MENGACGGTQPLTLAVTPFSAQCMKGTTTIVPAWAVRVIHAGEPSLVATATDIEICGGDDTEIKLFTFNNWKLTLNPKTVACETNPDFIELTRLPFPHERKEVQDSGEAKASSVADAKLRKAAKHILS